MKIIRYEDRSGRIHYANALENGAYLRLDGTLFGGLLETGEAAEIRRQLAPVTPAMIWCVGQNYRRHASLTRDILKVDCVRLDGCMVVFRCIRRLRESKRRRHQNTRKQEHP